MFNRLKSAAGSFKREVQVYQLVRRHPRTPKLAKFLIGAAVVYSLSPVDLIPDFIPVLGHLDDVVIVPLLLIAALKLIPKDVLAECRAKAESRAPLNTTAPAGIPK
jgi:uncharacterized membrane protein YkvA (DUF1232 family)